MVSNTHTVPLASQLPATGARPHADAAPSPGAAGDAPPPSTASAWGDKLRAAVEANRPAIEQAVDGVLAVVGAILLSVLLSGRRTTRREE